MEEETQVKLPEQKESIKLTKGMKDTYSWEIKVLGDSEEPGIGDKAIARLKKIDDKLKDEFLKGGDEDD